LTIAKYYLSNVGSITSALCLGGNTGGVVDTVEKWSGSSWSTITSFNDARYSAGCAGNSLAALIYGGTSGSNYYISTEKWNGSTWSTTISLNTGRTGLTGFGTMGSLGTALAAGGSTSGGQISSTEIWYEAAVPTVITFTKNPDNASLLNFKLIQDSRGYETVTWPASVLDVRSLSTAANDIDNIRFYFDGINYWDDVDEENVQLLQCTSSLTTSLNVTTPVAIGFDGEDFKDSIYSHSNISSNSQITILRSGIYRICYNISSTASGPRDIRVRMRVNGSTYYTLGTSYSQSHNSSNPRANNHSSFAVQFSDNDYFELMADNVGSSTTITMMANESTVTIELVRYI
jgi:hypothetical protein